MGIRTTLQRYDSTALGASEVTLLELANAYRVMAGGSPAEPHVIYKIQNTRGGIVYSYDGACCLANRNDSGLSLIQEGLRGVVRIPSGTAHALDSPAFAIPVMGKTGTTNNYRDALFIGSTYGPDGITVAVRMGFDDNRSLGARETGALVALPAFREIIRKVYQEKLAGPAPKFPVEMEASINAYLRGELPPRDSTGAVNPVGVTRSDVDRTGGCSAKPVLLSTCGCEVPGSRRNTIYPSKDENGRIILTNDSNRPCGVGPPVMMK
jgi:membrane carboxypeptidase/penicillin-binding protein